MIRPFVSEPYIELIKVFMRLGIGKQYLSFGQFHSVPVMRVTTFAQ